jgi:hypothetical protein
LPIDNISVNKGSVYTVSVYGVSADKEAVDKVAEDKVHVTVVCGKALIMSLKSSRDDSMVLRLTSVVDLTINLNGWFFMLVFEYFVDVRDILFCVKN